MMPQARLPTALAAFAMLQTTWSSSLSPRACDCWKTKEDGLLFTNYKMIDFRSLTNYVGSVPSVLEDYDANADAQTTSDYFNSATWSDFFGLQTWGTDDTAVRMINSKNNVYLQQDTDSSTYLTLRTHRSADFQSAAEFDSNDDSFTSVSMRVRARVHGDAGACGGIFTFKAEEDHTQHESDIEILTYESSSTVQYTTHPEEETLEGEGEWNIATDMPNGAEWTDWHEYRMDWTEPTTTYYVDADQNGQLHHEVTQFPSNLCFNMWSQGNDEWEKTMSVGGTAYMDFQYIEVAYNTSAGGASCTNICTLD
ncbi:Beta-glucanase 4 [Seiridium cupressi]